MDIHNKVAIVTGSSKGIGWATCRLLLENGMKVAGWSRSETKIAHANFENIRMDIRNHDSVAEAFTQTKTRFGNDIHVLINNAGLGFEAPFEELSPERWDMMFQTNVNGIFYATRQVLPQMKALGESHIINIASIAGLTGIPNMSGYCATKYAVRGLSHSLYKEVRNEGVKVTCIYPGSVNTHFFDDIDSVTTNENMMRPQDIAGTILNCLQTHPNYHQIDIEVRPLMPKGRKK